MIVIDCEAKIDLPFWDGKQFNLSGLNGKELSEASGKIKAIALGGTVPLVMRIDAPEILNGATFFINLTETESAIADIIEKANCLLAEWDEQEGVGLNI